VRQRHQDRLYPAPASRRAGHRPRDRHPHQRARDFGRVDFLVGLLAEHAEDLGEPYTRHLGGKIRELRFHLLREQTRITYWLAPQRRVILLTVFRNTRRAETAEVARALRPQEICESTHTIAHEVFDREVT
jgi:phage-related protein